MTAISLPRDWTKSVRSGVVHAVAVASVALTRAWARQRAVNDRSKLLLSATAPEPRSLSSEKN